MSGGISPNKLNDISKVYLDMVTNINKKEQEADAKRWTQKEETGCKTESPFKKKKVKEDYESQKKKEVLAAMKKQGRKLSAKDKSKIAADIVKRKGDTSKSDDRYAYESKLWDEVAAHLTELGELNDAHFKVEGYQRNPEKDPQNKPYKKKTKAEKMADPDRGINSPAFKEFMRSRGM